MIARSVARHMREWNWKKISVTSVTVVVGALVVFIAWYAVRGLVGWNQIDRVDYDTASARGRLGAPGNLGVSDWDLRYDSVLAIGSDERPPDFISEQEDAYADAVIMYLEPTDGEDPLIVSFPRDLLMDNPCTDEETKLDRLLEGCGAEVSGAELVALAIEDFTGITVDHFALFGFEGFIEVIDSLGGVELCVENPVRQSESEQLPAGCSTADGETALWFARSRSLEEQVDGEWRFVEGVSDLDRARRQQEVLFALLGRLKGMRDPGTLVAISEQLSDLVVLSESLSLTEAVGMGWDLRSTPSSRFRRVILPTEATTTPDGDFARRATIEFAELLEDRA